MSLEETVEKVKNPGTLLESILQKMNEEDSNYLIFLLSETDTPCSTISLALNLEGHTISERTLQKERVKLVSERHN